MMTGKNRWLFVRLFNVYFYETTLLAPHGSIINIDNVLKKDEI